jgi:type IV pilus assembly protein PilE
MAQVANRTGFTLIEVMVALVIVAIAASFAFASYRRFMLRGYRLEAIESLLTAAAEQEKFYLAHGRYSDTLADLRVPSTTPRHHYAMTIELADASVFRIVAVPASDSGQRDDKDCRQLSIDESGRRQAIDSAGSDSTRRCW